MVDGAFYFDGISFYLLVVSVVKLESRFNKGGPSLPNKVDLTIRTWLKYNFRNRRIVLNDDSTSRGRYVASGVLTSISNDMLTYLGGIQ